MSLYTAFRGATPNKDGLLKARGLWVEPDKTEENTDSSDNEPQDEPERLLPN